MEPAASHVRRSMSQRTMQVTEQHRLLTAYIFACARRALQLLCKWRFSGDTAAAES
jgi:hypothetical protein